MLRSTMVLTACLFVSSAFAQSEGNPLARGPQGDTAAGAPAGLTMPDFLKPGLRIVQMRSDATIPNVYQVYVPDENGGWTINGQKVSLQNVPGAGGAGYRVLDVVARTADGVALNSANYLLDVQTGNCTNTNQYETMLGNASNIEDYWVNPAKLAAMQNSSQGGVTVLRGQYPLDGKTYDTVSVTVVTDKSASRHVYDLETGLCIVFSASNVGATAYVPSGDGKASQSVTGTGLVYNKLVAVRDVKLPWSAQKFPAELLTEGRGSRWTGVTTTSIPGSPAMQQPFAATMEVEKKVDDSAVVMAISFGQGTPPVKRIAHAGAAGAMWIDPNTFSRLQPGQVLDEDRVTRTTLSVAGMQNGLFCFVEKRPTEVVAFAYDPRTGYLVAMETSTTSGIATITTALRRE
jgi:hypothetical protein